MLGDSPPKRCAPYFEYDNSRSIGPNRGVYDLGGTRRFLDEVVGIWESVSYEADESIEAGEHLVTQFTTTVRGRDGIEVQAHPTFVFTIRDGAISRLCMEAVGLRE